MQCTLMFQCSTYLYPVKDSQSPSITVLVQASGLLNTPSSFAAWLFDARLRPSYSPLYYLDSCSLLSPQTYFKILKQHQATGLVVYGQVSKKSTKDVPNQIGRLLANHPLQRKWYKSLIALYFDGLPPYLQQ